MLLGRREPRAGAEPRKRVGVAVDDQEAAVPSAWLGSVILDEVESTMLSPRCPRT
jgi:hypothetical protein